MTAEASVKRMLGSRRLAGDVELAELRVVMASRSLQPRHLASMTRVSAQRISNVLAGGDKSWPIRAAINEALGQNIFAKPPLRTRSRKNAVLPPEPLQPPKPANRMLDPKSVFTRH